MADAYAIDGSGMRGTDTQEREREGDDDRELGRAGHCARRAQLHSKLNLFFFSFFCFTISLLFPI